MSKVVFFGFPGHGHTNPTLGVVKELIARGEEVIYFSVPQFKSKIESTGAEFRSYKLPFLLQNKMAKKVNYNALNQAGKEAFHRMGLYFGILENKRHDIKKEIVAIKPDYVIHDSSANWGRFLARQLRIPAICSVTTFAYCDSILKLHPEFVFQKILQIPEQYVNDPQEAQKVIRRMTQMIGNLFKLPEYDFFDLAYSHEPFNIVFTSKEFQCYGELFDDSFKFVGPCLEFRKDSSGISLNRLAGKDLIYISLGTVDNRNPSYPDFYRKCFKAFENLGRQVVMAVGPLSFRKLGKIPENFIVRRWVPQLEILKQAALFITHGGMNSASEALYLNVPMIVIPQRVDQFQVAWRVADLGAGIEMKKKEISPQELQAAANEILTNESYRQRGQKIRDSFIAAGGHQRAVNEIFQFKSDSGIK
jgi:MGT family glycosyltransferase